MTTDIAGKPIPEWPCHLCKQTRPLWAYVNAAPDATNGAVMVPICRECTSAQVLSWSRMDPLAAAERAVLDAADEWDRDGRRYIGPLGRATRYWRRLRAARKETR